MSNSYATFASSSSTVPDSRTATQSRLVKSQESHVRGKEYIKKYNLYFFLMTVNFTKYSGQLIFIFAHSKHFMVTLN